MLKPPKYSSLYFLCLLLFLSMVGRAQEIQKNTIGLIPYIQQLEKDFNIKFSYVDEDLASLSIRIDPEKVSLEAILEGIRNETQLQIKKLNDRYYTLSKRNLVTICAFLVDISDNNPLINATVEVMGSSIRRISDFEGQFTLHEIPREANIAIRHLGYKTIYIKAQDYVSQRPCRSVTMSPNIQELNEVIVYNYLTEGLSKQKDASISLNTEEFGILPGLIEPDVLQTIQALPGIKSVDETVSDINIRGGTNDQNLVLWDGIKMYQTGHFFGLISAFNPYLTEKVTIIKNGTSVEYGDGVSSVIAMESKNKVNKTFEGGAGFNLLSGDIFAHIPIANKLSAQFSARRSTTDFVKTPTYNRFFDKVFQDSEVKENNGTSEDQDIVRNEEFYFYDFTGKILYDINEKQKIRLNFITLDNNLQYSEKSNTSESKSLLDQTNLSFGGSLDSQWTPGLGSSLAVFYTRYNLDAQNTSSESQQLFQNNLVLETGIKLNTHYQLWQNLNWLNGYQFNEVGITNTANVTQPPFNSNIKGVIRTHALFSELAYQSDNRKLVARAGARLNYIENLNTFTKFILEPRLNINVLLAPFFRADILGEYKSQTTNQIIDLEQNFLGIEKRRWILSDEKYLPITKSKQASFGLNYDRRSLYIGIEAFYKEVTGISTATQGFQNEDQFNGEIGSYDVKGIEFLINKKTNKYSTWFSYSFNDNTYTFKDISPNKFPNNLDIRHTITFAGTYTYKKFKFGLGANYHTGKPYTKPQQKDNIIDLGIFPNKINYESPNSSRLPDYLRIDSSFVYGFTLGKGIKSSMGISVLNLLNRRNLLNTYYRINENDEIETVERISLGITPNVSFRLKF
ncbi:Outer membrane receptor proteins, mostly Fe transport [Arenibacter nanhaiticus]|uniref:Outer membrane receptor proteins, mostly Fe transport n=2 Tax=Arenibacter nanhaiticus TaxID=558155 RepID=A0A1M6EYZ7_9FLAO|nr:Outer membrane receptor proteins, mostly Fe transport [Arenibacter nanhaiticus]